MSKKAIDPITRKFMEYFSKELGCKFIDADTGEEIEVEQRKHMD